MHLTREADYAIRIMYTLAVNDALTDAGSIAESIAVSKRFTLKILGKLMEIGLVSSKLGAGGGYYLSKSKYDISIADIVEAIEGPIGLSSCLVSQYQCERVTDCSACVFHCMFDSLSRHLRDRLAGISIGSAADMSPEDMIRSMELTTPLAQYETENNHQKVNQSRRNFGMKKFVCKVCGYIYEGESLPEDFICPICKQGADKFLRIE